MKRSILVAMVVLVAGCSKDNGGMLTPEPDPGPGKTQFFPLAVGTQWDYDLTNHVAFYDADGAELQPPTVLTGTGKRTILQTETLDGVEYFVEQEELVGDPALPHLFSWRRFRQDDAGLYRVNVSQSYAPGSIPDGTVITELMRLEYPLEMGKSWKIAPQSPITWTVIDVDTVTVSGKTIEAFVLSVYIPGFGPDDYRHSWMSREGELKLVNHKETYATDYTTGEVVHIVQNETTAIAGLGE